MKKKNVLNLIKYYSEKNDAGFRSEAYEIAKSFDSIGDYKLAEYIMALMSDTNTFVPQTSEEDLSFFRKIDPSYDSLPLPEAIKEDVIGIVNAVGYKAGVNKFLFEGAPGTGKTETAKQIARILERDLYMVDFDSVIDSKLGQTSKNIAALFREIHDLRYPERAIILFDEIDAIALDRMNSNDIREMGRATSGVLKGMDGLDERVILIATTNLYKAFDRAMSRRFDFMINFDRYSREDLIEVAESMMNDLLNTFKAAGRDMRLFKKIINMYKEIPYPGDLKNVLKTSVAFSSPDSEFDYLRKLFYTINGNDYEINIGELKKRGFTIREIETLTGISKSQVARELK